MSKLCETGDTGKRYEHTCEDSDGKVIVFGWSDEPGAFSDAIKFNPSFFNHEVRDRNPNQEQGEQP